VLCGLWDQAVRVRLNQAGKGSLRERFVFAWDERRLTIIGSFFVLVSVVVGLVQS
jgi:hypothetical protein